MRRSISFLVLWGTLITLYLDSTTSANAQVIDIRNRRRSIVSGQTVRNTVTPTVVPSINFTHIQTHIDAGSLGNPRFSGPLTTDEQALITFDSTVPVQVTISGGGDLKNAQRGNKIPTALKMRIQGSGQYKNVTTGQDADFNNANFSAISPLIIESDDVSQITFDPNIGKGYANAIATQLEVQRHGLNDGAGEYETSWTLSWIHW